MLYLLEQGSLPQVIYTSFLRFETGNFQCGFCVWCSKSCNPAVYLGPRVLTVQVPLCKEHLLGTSLLVSFLNFFPLHYQEGYGRFLVHIKVYSVN